MTPPSSGTLDCFLRRSRHRGPPTPTARFLAMPRRWQMPSRLMCRMRCRASRLGLVSLLINVAERRRACAGPCVG
eukprot:1197494-Lingulodinium_polyedra.AAC.1